MAMAPSWGGGGVGGMGQVGAGGGGAAAAAGGGATGLLGNINIKGLQLASLLGMLAEALGQDSIGGNLGQFAQQASAGPLKMNALQEMMQANQGASQEPMSNFPQALLMASMLGGS